MAPKAAKSRLGVAVRLVQQCTKLVGGLDTPPIGPALSALSGAELADAVVCARLTKHFGKREVSPELRRERALSEMIRHDAEGLSSFDYRKLPQRERRHFLLAQSALVDFGKTVKRSWGFAFPSGETVEPSQGHTDMLTKLSCGDQWRVSFEAAPEAAAILYHNQALRGVVKARFRELYPHYKFLADTWFSESGNRFQVFKRMFLACCTIQNYSRLSSVRKNSETDRPISMEPMFNMMAQLSFAKDLRAGLSRKYGYDLNTRAQLHRTLIRHGNKATVDLRNASNSNWWCVIRALWPKSLVGTLERLRTPVCYYKGKYHHYNMLAPMGCGFTFEVMSITLLHLARVLDPGATVFGDDIIIEADQYEPFRALLVALGWEINGDKTFVEGNFRESCGGFHDLTTDTAIVSYELHEVSNLADVCTTLNKLRHLIQAGQISMKLKAILVEYWVAIAKTMPGVAFRPESRYLDPLPQGCVLVPDHWYNNTKAVRSVMSQCYSAMYHREVAIGTRYRLSLEEDTTVSPSEKIRFACYMRRGCSYKPMVQNSGQCTSERVIVEGEGLLQASPLLSFI